MEIEHVFSRGVVDFIDPNNTFQEKVQQKIAGTYTSDIVIKLGVDPTRPDIHLGHAVILRKLRALQDVGCKVVFLIGDYTSQIGDPTGKSKVRPEISQQEIEENMKTYLEQVGKILRTDKEVFSWIRNSDWYTSVTDIEPQPGLKINFNSFVLNSQSTMGKAFVFEETRMQKRDLKNNQIHAVSFSRILGTLRRITHARLIERDMFQERIASGGELYMHEMLYPVLQGIDSALIHSIYGSCDLEIGGTDQTFNMLMGRDVMKINNQPEQSVMSLDILPGTDGKEKMSKSLDNYIGITDEPNDMYGKVMSLPDDVLKTYFLLTTPINESEIEEILKGHPKEAKMKLAKTITAMYHGEESAQEAEDGFENTFAKGGIPEDVQEVEKKETIVDTLLAAECVASKTEGRRLIENGAVTHLESGEKVSDPNISPQEGTYKIGKHRFCKIK